MDIIYQLADIDDVARRFWNTFQNHKLFAFYGAMASGKTTFIHSLCMAKNVQGVVTSPTYSIINQYKYNHGDIYHIDLYRLKDEQEALQAGVEDCLYSDMICFVEWPERAPGIFPAGTIKVFMEVIDESTRRITIDEN